MTDSTVSTGTIAASGTKSRPDLFRRKLKVRQVTDGDLAYFWAAYQEGAFSDSILPSLPPATFQQAMIDMMSTVPYDWVVVADKPVGLFLGNSMAAGRGAEIQVDWMPWATPRLKMEATATFLREASKTLKLFIFSSIAHEAFFQRLSRYRLLTKGCTVHNYFGGGEDAKMFYSAGPF